MAICPFQVDGAVFGRKGRPRLGKRFPSVSPCSPCLAVWVQRSARALQDADRTTGRNDGGHDHGSVRKLDQPSGFWVRVWTVFGQPTHNPLLGTSRKFTHRITEVTKKASNSFDRVSRISCHYIIFHYCPSLPSLPHLQVVTIGSSIMIDDHSLAEKQVYRSNVGGKGTDVWKCTWCIFAE